MLQGNYDQIVKLISENSNMPVEDIERKIEAKRAKLSGLISKEGAAQIIASELGISFDKQKMKISNLLSGMRKINLAGKIIRINKIVEYNKNGKSGKIGSFTLADDTSNIRVVLWDTNHIEIFEKGEMKEGDVIEISNGDVRNSEIHVSGFGDIKKSSLTFDNVQTKIQLTEKKINNVRLNDNVSIRAFIVQMFGPTFFNVCSECGKRVYETNECEKHGKITPKKNAILTLILDDGTENIRAVLFSESIKNLIKLEEVPDLEKFAVIRNDLMGREIIIEANARKNKLSENMELFANNIKEVDIDKLIEELEK